MPSFWRTCAFGTALLLSSPIIPFSSANPSCTYLEIPITATAENTNFVIPAGLNYSNPASISAAIQTIIGDSDAGYPFIPTTFDGIIAARYCEPEVKIANRSNTIQLFMSGVTENNLYWFGLGYPVSFSLKNCFRPFLCGFDFMVSTSNPNSRTIQNGYDGNMYSTVDYASKQGYPTLAIDRAGVGNSTHPDPIVQLQVNLETAISHQLVLGLKAGTTVPGTYLSPLISTLVY